jgi:dTDP-glucose 4,6-dehydratase
MMSQPILVTGGAGFIGSNFVTGQVQAGGAVVNVDKLTYAGNLHNLDSIAGSPLHHFVHGSINDDALLAELFSKYEPLSVVHFAAESHVDRSILDPGAFVETNVKGTYTLLNSALRYWEKLSPEKRDRFRFLHVSTDEVYGSLGEGDAPFTEKHPYAPSSPYAASKAAADHLVRAYGLTYGLPVIITNCSNNYGPFQFPEKLIPLMLLRACRRLPMPVYGNGRNVRDWLHVSDHCDAIRLILEKGLPGETYNIGGASERSNIEVVREICHLVDEVRPGSTDTFQLVEFVTDRPGHDLRYAIDFSKLQRELGWVPRITFSAGLRKTLEWYLANDAWVAAATKSTYEDWMDLNYGKRGTARCEV